MMAQIFGRKKIVASMTEIKEIDVDIAQLAKESVKSIKKAVTVTETRKFAGQSIQ
jgi:hypothetical protein